MARTVRSDDMDFIYRVVILTRMPDRIVTKTLGPYVSKSAAEGIVTTRSKQQYNYPTTIYLERTDTYWGVSRVEYGRTYEEDPR